MTKIEKKGIRTLAPKQEKLKKEENPEVKADGKTHEVLLARPVDPDLLFTTYDNSFLISGIIHKIASSADVGFEEIKDPELADYLEKVNFRESFINTLVYGNIFFEDVRTLARKPHSLYQIVTRTMKKKGDGGYQQTYRGGTVDFTPEEILHIKLSSMSSSHYGDSSFSQCVQQICLLQSIDDYYTKLMQRGMFDPILLTDKDDKLDDNAEEALKATLQDQFRGKDNLQAIGIIPADVGVIELVKKMDTKAFLEYRAEVIKSIAIGMNISYSMLINDNSNKATSGTEYEVFLKEIVKPFQRAFLEQLKNFLRKQGYFKPESIDELAFITVDTKNEKEQMETRTGYRKSGVVTANEVRTTLGYGPIDGGDVIETRLSPEQTAQNMDQVNKQIAKLYQS